MHIAQQTYLSAMASYEKYGDFGQLVYMAAKMYAADGLKVVPLRQGQKILVAEAGGYSRSFAIKDAAEQFAPGKRYYGYNIGLVCGGPDNVFALDVDRHGDSDGVDTLAALMADHGQLPAGPVATTPRGGLHYLFAPVPGVGNSVGLLGPGLDTRGSKQDGSPAGHIACWPSVVDGKMYEWEQFGEVPQAPEWLIVALTSRSPGAPGAPPPPVRLTDTPPMAGRETNNVVYMNLSQSAEIGEMLRTLDPGKLNYEEWLRVGMAINSYNPTREGLLMWDEWSRRGERYVPGECHSRWDGFKPPDGERSVVTIGTLALMAKPFGYRVPKSVSDGIGNDEHPSILNIVSEFNTTHAVVMAGSSLRILEREPGERYFLMSVRDAITKYQNVTKIYEDPTGMAIACRVFETWLKHPNRRMVYNFGLYDPEHEPPNTFNMWEGWPVEPVKGDATIYINHIRHRICRGDEDITNWVLDWIADMFQTPFTRPGTALVIHGGEGTGKGAMVEVLGKLIGGPFGKVTSADHIGGRFNGNLQDKLLIFVDEATWAGGHKANSFLKNLVTSPTISIERKGVDVIEARNLARLIICTNDEWAIPAGPDSRRWAVMRTADKEPGDDRYFQNLFRWMDNSAGVLLHYFLHRTITNDLATAPITEALLDQRMETQEQDTKASYYGPVSWLADIAFDSHEFPIPAHGKANIDGTGWPTMVSAPALYDAYLQDHNEKRKEGHARNKVAFCKALTSKLGTKSIKVRLGANEFGRAMVLPPREEIKKKVLAMWPGYKYLQGEEE